NDILEKDRCFDNMFKRPKKTKIAII
ncbi:uncharacterized protein METZ01_LOCUS337090, partial [marine metagenome]